MKKTCLTIIFIDISVAAALLHLGGKENRICQSLLCLPAENKQWSTNLSGDTENQLYSHIDQAQSIHF